VPDARGVVTGAGRGIGAAKLISSALVLRATVIHVAILDGEFAGEIAGPAEVVNMPSRISGRIAFSPDGALLAAAYYGSGFALVWDVTTGTLRETLDDHEGPLYDVAFTRRHQYRHRLW
jgi:WD40 repeat protein